MLKVSSLIIGLAIVGMFANSANAEGTPAATTATTTTTTAEAKWVAGNVPAEATLAGISNGKPMNICRMPMPNKEVHFGKAWNGNCYVGFGGKELKAPIAKAEVLVVGNTSWVAVADGKLPETTYQAGTSAGKPMNICRTKVPSGEMHAGKLWNGNCYVGFGGKEIKSTTFEVMTVTK
jgi:hypothetical protein